MYIDYNGLTRLRIVGLYGILLIVVGLSVMVWKVGRSQSFMWIIRRDLLAFWAALVILALTPRDTICWKYNASRVMDGDLKPLALLTVQKISPEGYPPLLRLLDHREAWVREGVAAFLGRYSERLFSESVPNWTGWQGAHTWARWELRRAVGRIESIVPRSRWIAVEERFFKRVRPWVYSRVTRPYD